MVQISHLEIGYLGFDFCSLSNDKIFLMGLAMTHLFFFVRKQSFLPNV
jgi:hypothetical protein